MAFDRLIYIDRLKGAGVDENVARSHAEALRDAPGETVATTADVADAVRELMGSVVALERKVDDNFATLDRKVDTNFAMLDRKVDALGSILTIRAGSAFLFLVTLIVGLKYPVGRHGLKPPS